MEKPADPVAASPALAFKAALLMILVAVLIGGSVLYLLYARGVFERTQQVVLISDDSEGVVVGMDVTFSGFPIGRVSRISLAPDGNARIVVDIAQSDARWLRVSSVFTQERGLVGGTRIRAYSGMLDDPPLPDGAERHVLRGDASAEIPRLVNSMRELLANLQAMTATDSPLNTGLRDIKGLTGRLAGRQGVLGALLGNDADAQKLLTALDRVKTLLARLDGLAVKADDQVFGAKGVMPEARATVVQLHALLTDARASLKKVDAVLVQAQAIANNAREGTNDLGALRADVEASLRKVDHLVNEINRKWPFARETEIRLP